MLYQEATRQRDAVIQEMTQTTQANQERLEYLTALNIKLQEVVKNLEADLGKQTGDHIEKRGLRVLLHQHQAASAMNGVRAEQTAALDETSGSQRNFSALVGRTGWGRCRFGLQCAGAVAATRPPAPMNPGTAPFGM